jgi:signal transduction protein with GAF and PtsI domain
LSGQDVETAQREQRRARREVEQFLRKRLDDLDVIAERLLEGLDPEVA